jgi:hypothetical protein
MYSWAFRHYLSIMGFGCGFDTVPRLTESDSEKSRSLAFIDELKEVYNEDPVLQVQPRVVTFQVGEHPQLPLEGHNFLRFSSKVSWATTTAPEPYIHQVYRVAREVIGQRVHFGTNFTIIMDIMIGTQSKSPSKATIIRSVFHSSVLLFFQHPSSLQKHVQPQFPDQ